METKDKKKNHIIFTEKSIEPVNQCSDCKYEYCLIVIVKENCCDSNEREIEIRNEKSDNYEEWNDNVKNDVKGKEITFKLTND